MCLGGPDMVNDWDSSSASMHDEFADCSKLVENEVYQDEGYHWCSERSDILLVQLGQRNRSFTTGHDLWYLSVLRHIFSLRICLACSV